MVLARIMLSLTLLLPLCGAGEAAAKSVKKAAVVVVPKKEGEVPRSGRYQLLPVEFSSHDLVNDVVVTKKELILLDTATGRMQLCAQKIWTNVAAGRDISERRCLPFETYGEQPAGTMRGKKAQDVALPRP